MRLKSQWFSYLTILVAGVVSVAAPGHADVILIDDTFDVPFGADRSDDASDPLDAAWWNYGSGTISYATDNGTPGIGNDNTMVLEGTSPKIIGNFTDTALVNVGDWVELRFNLRDVSGVASGSIRFGLYNSNPDSQANSVVDADGQASRTTNDVGHWVILEPPDGFIGIKDSGTFFSGSTIESTTEGALSDAPHEIALRITKASPTQMQVSVDYDSSQVATVLDSSVTDLFNEVAIFQTSGTDLRLDDIRVITNVPEPGSLGLLAAGLLLTARRKR